MARLHAVVGLLFAAVFVLTGAYMRQEFPPPEEDNAVMRMIFRSTHVYILLGALPNLLLAAYYADSAGMNSTKSVTSMMPTGLPDASSTGSSLILPSDIKRTDARAETLFRAEARTYGFANR